jgi:hypothetical protein
VKVEAEVEVEKKNSNQNQSHLIKVSKNIRNSERKSRWSDAPQIIQENNINIYDSVSDSLSFPDKYKQINPMVNIGVNELNSMSNLQNMQNPLLYNPLTDITKIKRKVKIPYQPGVNFVGLLIGPKGTYQKRLETQTGCKILIRGK